MKIKPLRSIAVAVLLLYAFACSPPISFAETIRQPVIERGIPILPLDWLARILAFPEQIIFWNLKLKNRSVSDATLEDLRQFMIFYELHDVKVRVNRMAVLDEYKRLFTNKNVSFIFKIFPGFFVTTLSLPFERITAGDYYNPYTNSIHIFSDIPAVALHEAGHAKDMQSQGDGGLYAVMRAIPGMDLIQEDAATTTAINYFILKQDIKNEMSAYKILYPAFGSYIGAYLSPVLPLRTSAIGAILAGHWIGRKKARERTILYNNYSKNLISEKKPIPVVLPLPTSV